MELDSVLCRTHGWVSHVAVHEAAHAVIAHARGIPFLGITIARPDQLLGALPGQPAVAGGLHLTTADPRSWVPQRGDAAIDMLMAGHTAERLVFGHTLHDSYAGDMTILGRGMGWTQPPQDQQAKQTRLDALERSTARLERELPERYPSIKRVAGELIRDLNTNELGRYTGFDQILFLSAEDIIVLIEDQ